MRRSISLFLAILMVLSTLTVMSFSVSADDSGEGWELKDGVLTVSGQIAPVAKDAYPWYSHASEITKVVVEGTAVMVPSHAFEGAYTALKEVVIEEGVTTLDSDAFAYNIGGFDSVTFPASLKVMNQGVFFNTRVAEIKTLFFTKELFQASLTTCAPYNFDGGLADAKNVYIGEESMFTLEDGVLTVFADFDLGTNSQESYPWFSMAADIQKVVFADGVTVAGERAFSSTAYANLTEIVIPQSVKTIKYNAFSNLKALTTITLPATVTSIADGAFYNCTALATVNGGFADPEVLYSITGKNYNGPLRDAEYKFIYEGIYTLEDGVLTVLVDKDYDAAADYEWYDERARVTKAVFANGVTTIGHRALESYSNLKTIVVSQSVTTILNDAFAGNGQLETIVIPNSVTTIAQGVMINTGNLKNVYSNFESAAEFAKVWGKKAYNGGFGTKADLEAAGIEVETYDKTNWNHSEDCKFVYVGDMDIVGDSVEVGYAGTQQSETENAIRFVASTTSLDFVKVGMIISTKAGEEVKSWNVDTDTVFTSLNGYSDAAEEGEYLYGAALTGIDAGEYTFTILPYAVTADGIVVGSAAIVNANVTANSSTIA